MGRYSVQVTDQGNLKIMKHMLQMASVLPGKLIYCSYSNNKRIEYRTDHRNIFQMITELELYLQHSDLNIYKWMQTDFHFLKCDLVLTCQMNLLLQEVAFSSQCRATHWRYPTVRLSACASTVCNAALKNRSNQLLLTPGILLNKTISCITAKENFFMLYKYVA